MTKETYVKKIVKRVRCDKKRRQDIGRELLTEIQERMSGGEALEDIMREMGSIREIADSFNESLSEADRKKYRQKRLLCVVLIVGAVCAVLRMGAVWLLPSARDLESSQVFSRAEVESTLKEVIDLLDEEDYAALRDMATPQMATALQEQTMGEAKAQFSGDFGDRISLGAIYSTEVVQQHRHMAVCQVNVSYENTGITYTVTFDEDMRIAGLYMK